MCISLRISPTFPSKLRGLLTKLEGLKPPQLNRILRPRPSNNIPFAINVIWHLMPSTIHINYSFHPSTISSTIQQMLSFPSIACQPAISTLSRPSGHCRNHCIIPPYLILSAKRLFGAFRSVRRLDHPFRRQRSD